MKKDWQYARIGKQYQFSAAHRLPHVHDQHPCHRLHGHNYVVEFEVRGEICHQGFCNGIDFNEMDKEVKRLIDIVDHQYLNDIDGLENPTAENIAAWFLHNFKTKYLFSVKVWETPKCWAMVTQSSGQFPKVHKE